MVNVPNGHFQMEAWNSADGVFTNTAQDIMCNADKDVAKKPLSNCQLYFQAFTNKRSMNLFRLTYDSKFDNQRKAVAAKEGDSIRAADHSQSLVLQGFNS